LEHFSFWGSKKGNTQSPIECHKYLLALLFLLFNQCPDLSFYDFLS
jgi:hypothetical protein